MIKEWYSGAEVARLWNCTKAYVFKIVRQGKIEGSTDNLQGSKLKIPIQSLFYGKHKDLILWGEPYKDGEEWKLKKHTADGEKECKIIEGD